MNNIFIFFCLGLNNYMLSEHFSVNSSPECSNKEK